MTFISRVISEIILPGHVFFSRVMLDKEYEREAIDFSINFNVLFNYRIPKFYNLLHIDKK